MNQRNGAQQAQANNFQRYQPYVFNVKRNDEPSNCNNSAAATNQNGLGTFVTNSATTVNKTTDLKKTVYKNKSKTKEKSGE